MSTATSPTPVDPSITVEVPRGTSKRFGGKIPTVIEEEVAMLRAASILINKRGV